VEAGGTTFGAYATTAGRCSVRFYDPSGHALATVGMEPADAGASAEWKGYFHTFVPTAGPGSLYRFVLDDGREFPDPCARYLPQGVLGPAMVVSSGYRWKHGWGPRRPLSDFVLYELHVGTFSAQGTYDGVAARARELAELGVTAVEIMPLAAFAGQRGWGYDGVAWFAPFAPYGTPDELRAMVDELHGAGLSVLLDVVYNHVGPAGCCLRDFSPDYFTAAIKSAWGDGLNYANPAMRRLVLDSALYWLDEFRFDGLRLDATHSIVDSSPEHILHALAASVAALEPERFLIAEDERNDPGCVRDLGLDAVWADDFHHVVRVTLTGEQDGYFAAYAPSAATIADTINHGWLYRGQVYPPRGEPRGKPATGLDAESLVYCIQNHDQVGNRAFGERLSAVVSHETYRAVSMLLLFLPMTPLLFMGQEWGARSPFLYFTDHAPELGRLISQGRREEFKCFTAFARPEVRQRIPDPQEASTFERSRLSWAERDQPEARQTLDLYRALLALRRSDPVLKQVTRDGLWAESRDELLLIKRSNRSGTRLLLLNLGGSAVVLDGHQEWSGQVLLASDGDTSQRSVLPPSTAVVMAIPA
jgi:maltooligosyltrehalose trehalohydrolase